MGPNVCFAWVNMDQGASQGGLKRLLYRYSQKNWVRVCNPLFKTLTLFKTKIANFPYPIYDLAKTSMAFLTPGALFSKAPETHFRAHRANFNKCVAKNRE